jgi:hypothetical protein
LQAAAPLAPQSCFAPSGHVTSHEPSPEHAHCAPFSQITAQLAWSWQLTAHEVPAAQLTLHDSSSPQANGAHVHDAQPGGHAKLHVLSLQAAHVHASSPVLPLAPLVPLVPLVPLAPPLALAPLLLSPVFVKRPSKSRPHPTDASAAVIAIALAAWDSARVSGLEWAATTVFPRRSD